MENNFPPDDVAYMMCLNAHAHCAAKNTCITTGSVDGTTGIRNTDITGPIVRAQEILDEMHEQYLDRDDTMKLKQKSIRILIDAWFKIGLPNCMEYAENLLD